MAYTQSFKQKHTFEQRRKEANRVLSKYLDKIPIICECSKFVNLPKLTTVRFLIPPDITAAHLVFIIRQRLKLSSTESIFLYIEDYMLSSSTVIGDIYMQKKDKDGFLYIQYSKENVFG